MLMEISTSENPNKRIKVVHSTKDPQEANLLEFNNKIICSDEQVIYTSKIISFPAFEYLTADEGCIFIDLIVQSRFDYVNLEYICKISDRSIINICKQASVSNKELLNFLTPRLLQLPFSYELYELASTFGIISKAHIVYIYLKSLKIPKEPVKDTCNYAVSHLHQLAMPPLKDEGFWIQLVEQLNDLKVPLWIAWNICFRCIDIENLERYVSKYNSLPSFCAISSLLKSCLPEEEYKCSLFCKLMIEKFAKV